MKKWSAVKKRHGAECPCMFCKLIEQGWTLIAPDGSIWKKESS